MYSKVENELLDLSVPIAQSMGYEIVDIEYKKEGTHWFLRFFIDKDEGINIDDCQDFSKKISDLLDEVNPIPHSYILEVSSPGIDRPLKRDKDFVKYKGESVDIKTYESIEGKKKLEGILEGLINDDVHLIIEGQKTVIPRDKISSIRLSVKF